MPKKYLKIIIISSSIAVALIIFLILFFNVPRVTYKYDSSYDGYIVTGAYGNASIYDIKDEYKGKNVVGIGTRAFYKHDKLKKIELPETIEVIEKLAFSECSNLESINLDKVDTIYRNAFSYCEKLNNIVISASQIGASAFYKCKALKICKLNNGILTIGSMAFSETGLETISIPRSVKSLEVDCFYNCFALRNISVYGNNLKDNKYLNSLSIVTYIG